METTYYVRGKVIPNKPCKIIAKDRVGAVIGEYVGYYKPERGVFALYPAKGQRFFGRLYRHEVSVSVVRRGDDGT